MLPTPRLFLLSPLGILLATLIVGCSQAQIKASPEVLAKRDKYLAQRISLSRDPACYFNCLKFGGDPVTPEELEVRLLENDHRDWIERLRHSNLTLADQQPSLRGPRGTLLVRSGEALALGGLLTGISTEDSNPGLSRAAAAVGLVGCVAWLSGMLGDFESHGPNAYWLWAYNRSLLSGLKINGSPDPTRTDEEVFTPEHVASPPPSAPPLFLKSFSW